MCAGLCVCVCMNLGNIARWLDANRARAQCDKSYEVYMNESDNVLDVFGYTNQIFPP